MRNRMNRNSGITLVALVITIIVLLILAGVTLNLTLGENGLLKRAEESKNAHLAGEKNDVEFMNSAYDYMNKYFENEEVALEKNGLKKLEKDEITNPNLKDNENIKAVITGEVPIPTGAEYKEGTKETGVVVAFGDSEFVWVPVPEINEMARLQSGSDVNYEGVLYEFEGTTATEMTDYGIGTENWREPDVLSNYDGKTEYLTVINNILGTNYTTSDQFKTALQTDYNEMVASVIKYKGFFVGRYETSLDENKRAKSKVGVIPARSEPGDKIDNPNMWYGLYAYQKKMAEVNNYVSVKSHMIWGSNYDAMLRWALTGEDARKVTETGNATHSILSGISGIYETGKVTIEGKVDRINNIYDLEGNGYEWTTELGDSYRTSRGGNFDYINSPSDRYGNYDQHYAAQVFCSRSILFIK